MSDNQEKDHENEVKNDQEEAVKAIFDDDEEIANDDDDDDEALSELDEEQFKDIDEDAIGLPITEEVYKLQRHKRTTEEGGTVKKRKTTKEKRRQRRSRVGAGTAGGAEHDDHDRVAAEPDDPATARTREIEERVDAALKTTKKKRRKADEDDLEAMQDDRVIDLRERMRQAAYADAEAVRAGVPATHKLAMLAEVRESVQKHAYADAILDNNLLESVRLWLEPLPDGSLPAYAIQSTLFAALETLPIKTAHLRESGVGKVVLFYHKSRRPQLGIKRTADKLVADWSRPIIGRRRAK
ncbi:hypothetical protein V1514DRAFT_333044 [Lipomyces japonicus]|uniref:uncharacterized protein n=1 Tax=Lipomyces japonicus TaxID=56871 RepID=UPI0034CEBF25